MVVLRDQLENPSAALVSALRASAGLDLNPVAASGDTGSDPLVLPQPRLTKSQVDEVVRAFQAGALVKELAGRYGVSRQTTAKHLQRRGVVTVNLLTKQEIETAIQLYTEGWSLVRIGDKLGRDQSSIWNVLRRAGIPRRDSHGRTK